MQSAQSAVDLARQTLDADQQKLKVGLTTQATILQDAATLRTGESNLVSAKAAYEKSRIELDRATGFLLDHAGIDITDATKGQVSHLPSVPSVAPAARHPCRLPSLNQPRDKVAPPSAHRTLVTKCGQWRLCKADRQVEGEGPAFLGESADAPDKLRPMQTSRRLELPTFFLWLLPLSFFLQIASIGLFHQYRVRPGNDHFEFGWEMGRVAPVHRSRPGIQQSVRRQYRPNRMGAAPLSLSNGRSVQAIRHLHAFIGLGAVDDQQLVRDADLPSHLPDRPQNVRRAHRLLVGYGWGLCPYVWYWSIHWIWDTTFTPFILCVHLSFGRLELQRLAGMAGLGSLRGVIWHRRPCQSNHAGVPSLLRILDLAAATSQWSTFARWIVVASLVFFSGACAVGSP